MTHSVLAIFTDRADAETAITDLEAEGYNPKDFSVITRDITEARAVEANTGAPVAEGAVSGAATGAAVGAIAGLLVGIGAITIPGIGAVLIGGPIAAALGLTGAAATTATGAITGALAGGIVGALVSLGVPEEQAQVYERRLQEGGILLIVPIRTDLTVEAKDILAENGAEQITVVSPR